MAAGQGYETLLRFHQESAHVATQEDFRTVTIVPAARAVPGEGAVSYLVRAEETRLLAAVDGGVWTAGEHDVVRLLSRTGEGAAIHLGTRVVGLAARAGVVWALLEDGVLARVDPGGHVLTVRGLERLVGKPLIVAAGVVGVAVGGPGGVVRLLGGDRAIPLRARVARGAGRVRSLALAAGVAWGVTEQPDASTALFSMPFASEPHPADIDAWEVVRPPGRLAPDRVAAPGAGGDPWLVTQSADGKGATLVPLDVVTGAPREAEATWLAPGVTALAGTRGGVLVRADEGLAVVGRRGTGRFLAEPPALGSGAPEHAADVHADVAWVAAGDRLSAVDLPF